MSELGRRGFVKAAGFAFAGGMLAAGGARAAEKPYGDVDASLFKGINRIADPEKLTHLEELHAPYITLPEKVSAGEPFRVEVSVGRTPHVMLPEHHITALTLMVGGNPVASVDFTTGVTPVVSFTLKLDKPATLIALARCNIHGLWEGRAEVNPA